MKWRASSGREMQKPCATSQPNCAKPVEYLVVLDAFGDDLETEVVAEIDRRSDDHLVLLVDQHVGDEALVDLQLARREAGAGS